jgi:hypothetical protein
MRPLTYSRAADTDDALALAAAHPASAFLAGGTTEVGSVALADPPWRQDTSAVNTAPSVSPAVASRVR